MGARIRLAAVFPVRYQPAVWLPAVGLTLGFLGMESVIHERHAGTVDWAGLPPDWLSLRAVWEFFYKAGYLLYFSPLLLPVVRSEDGRLRRVLIGFLLQLLLGAILLAVPPTLVDLLPCLHVANAFFLFLVIRRSGTGFLQAMALAALGLIAAATLATQRHDGTDILVGLSLGALSYGIAFSKKLFFLGQPDPWEGIDFELKNLWNLLIENSRKNWESTYAVGQWQFLESLQQRPRHYAIAGVIRDRFPEGADVLDIGCGYGTLCRLLGQQAKSFTGIDLARPAIEECRSAFRGDERYRFEAVAFEDFSPERKFDVVILNEVLYYFPLQSAEQVFRRALEHLKDESSLLIISMNKNLKGALIWWKLARRFVPEQSLRVRNMSTGSYWTVNVYRRVQGKGE